MNLGRQPTVDPEAPSAVEVHLLGVDLQLEGESLGVEPVRWLRGQQTFGSLEELSGQISRDASQATDLLAAQAAG
jgi:riboflavin kinase/FMN adenylyltransferase